MAKIILFGGHGRVAMLTHPLLNAAGHRVTAVLRNPDHADEVRSAGADPLVADVEQLDTAQLAELIAGHDAVVWSAGAGGGNPARTVAVDRDAAIRTMEAAAQAGVKRYVMVSYFNASPDHGIDPSNSFYTYAEAKAAADAHLRGTDLDWTILGPSTLTFDEASGLIDAEAAASGQVSRGNVARVIAAVIDNDSTVARTIPFNNGAVPVPEAVRG